MNPNDDGPVILNRSQSSEDTNSIAVRVPNCWGNAPEHAFFLSVSPLRTVMPPDLQLTHQCDLYDPLTSALEVAYKLLESSKDTTDFAFRHQLISRSLAIGDAVCNQIANPLSPYRPHSDDIRSAKELLLLCYSALIQLLCSDKYLTHRELIHRYMFELIRIYGYDVCRPNDPRITVAFQMIKESVEAIEWDVVYRIREWLTISDQVSQEPHFLGLLYWTYLSALRIELGKIDATLPDGVTDEMKDSIPELQVMVDRFISCMEAMAREGGVPEVDAFPRFWKTSEQYATLGNAMLQRFNRTKVEIETKWLLKKGDSLLEVATDRVRTIEYEYFEFQAKLALDRYRSAYNVCVAGEEINAELEGLCLWSMGHVMGQYLDLHDHAHQLYLQAVTLVTTISSLLPNGKWYSDAVEQIQWQRRRLEDHENRLHQMKTADVMGKLSLEMMELHYRAERVRDENTLRAFLAWLLWRYPPPSCQKDVKREMLGSRELSKVVLTVIAAYDTFANQNGDESWEVLCQEITKIINCFFGSSGVVVFGIGRQGFRE